MTNNPLNNKDVDGNTLSWMADQSLENSTSHKDQYRCDCGQLVTIDKWSEDYKLCLDCVWDKHVHYEPKKGYSIGEKNV